MHHSNQIGPAPTLRKLGPATPCRAAKRCGSRLGKQTAPGEGLSACRIVGRRRVWDLRFGVKGLGFRDIGFRVEVNYLCCQLMRADGTERMPSGRTQQSQTASSTLRAQPKAGAAQTATQVADTADCSTHASGIFPRSKPKRTPCSGNTYDAPHASKNKHRQHSFLSRLLSRVIVIGALSDMILYF